MKNSSAFENITFWNHKFHIFTGLFLFLFILLFSFSGLILNHGQWEFASFWKEKKESEKTMMITIPGRMESIPLIQILMKQLNISGEISNIRIIPAEINFRVMKPGTIHDIKVDRKTGKCIQKEMVYNFWGRIRTLHTFNGSTRLNPDLQPNWLITRIWRLTMDVTALGLIFLCISGWIMWYKIRQNYSYGWIILISGMELWYFLFFYCVCYKNLSWFQEIHIV